MKTYLPALILLLIVTRASGQITFEKGYFIDNDDKKTECLIKNQDWKNNPVTFIFKREGSEIPENGTISAMKEFGVYGSSRYIRATIKIDRSTDNVDELTPDRNPVWTVEQLFLEVLINGKASLYSYIDKDLKRFFYSVSDTTFNQLVYKKYLYEQGTDGQGLYAIAYNNAFQQQLLNDVSCGKTNTNTVIKLSYSKQDLERYFLNFNKCSGDPIVEVQNKPERDFFNLKITPGLNFSSMSLINTFRSYKNVDFGNSTGFRIGIEPEFILSFNKNKWSVLMEPTYQYYKVEQSVNGKNVKVDYRSVEFPIGIRYYMFLNPELKVFLNGFYISQASLTFNSTIDTPPTNNNIATYDISSGDSFSIGAGVEYKNISTEARYYTNRNLMNLHSEWYTDYNRLSVIIGYKILKVKHKK
jgi:hypothetical protein